MRLSENANLPFDKLMAEARARSEKLKWLNLQAYYTTKKRMRGPDMEHALSLFKDELPTKADVEDVEEKL